MDHLQVDKWHAPDLVSTTRDASMQVKGTGSQGPLMGTMIPMGPMLYVHPVVQNPSGIPINLWDALETNKLHIITCTLILGRNQKL
jgi:hypothetical protein